MGGETAVLESEQDLEWAGEMSFLGDFVEAGGSAMG